MQHITTEIPVISLYVILHVQSVFEIQKQEFRNGAVILFSGN